MFLNFINYIMVFKGTKKMIFTFYRFSLYSRFVMFNFLSDMFYFFLSESSGWMVSPKVEA